MTNVNLNPLTPRGRITRLPYLFTKIGIVTFLFIAQIVHGIAKEQNFNLMFLYVALILLLVIAEICVTSKRLRDIQWSQWILILWLFPYASVVISILLLFIKSKTDNSLIQE